VRTREERLLEDPGWGPTIASASVEGHVLVAGPPSGVADATRVTFADGAIGALVMSEGEVGGTGAAEEVRFGLAQVRRICRVGRVRVSHVVFAPREPRPLLLGLVRVANPSDDPVALRYTEHWDVPGGSFRAAEGACERESNGEVRALADAAAVVRARVPEPPPSRGLALDLAVVLPPGSIRDLSFAYVAPQGKSSAGRMVRAWRGEVARALTDVVASWLARVGAGSNAVEAFRREVGAPAIGREAG
jgi:hypothetical protein